MIRFKNKIYYAVFEYLTESMSLEESNDKASIIVEQIVKVNNEINEHLYDMTDINILTKEYHTLKNLLLYGDFYYECDLCQDIEEKLRETHDKSDVYALNEELQNSLKM